jgi:hypothetical protein
VAKATSNDDAAPDDTLHDRERATDEAAIRALHARVLAAWGQGSGEAFAAPLQRRC